MHHVFRNMLGESYQAMPFLFASPLPRLCISKQEFFTSSGAGHWFEEVVWLSLFSRISVALGYCCWDTN